MACCTREARRRNYMLLVNALVVQIKFCKVPVAPEAILIPSHPEPSPFVSSSTSTVSVAGKWEMSVPNKKGVQKWTLTLEQNGEILKGVIASEGGDLPVSGTIKGRAINLSAQRFGVTVDFPATLSGEMMTGSMRALTVTRQWTAKRM